jgi:hypothetical protein
MYVQSEEEREFLSAIIKMTNEINEEELVANANELRQVYPLLFALYTEPHQSPSR